MNVLAILTPKASARLADFEPLRVPEEQKVWEYYARGDLRAMSFQPEPMRVVLNFEAPDKSTIEGWLASFPMVEAGLFDVDLIAAGPWILLQSLFAEGR